MEQQASINERLADHQDDVRANALAELLQSGADVSPQVNAIADCLKGSSEPLHLMALQLLARIGAPAVEFLVPALSRSQTEGFRAIAAAIIAGIGPAAAVAVPALCRCLPSTDEVLRNAAAAALAKIGEPAVPALRVVLPLPFPEAVAAAVGALAMIGRPAEAAVPELEALASRSPLQLQLACGEALSCVTGDPARGLPILSKALDNPDPQIRKFAVEKIGGLGEVGHPAIPSLARCIGDSDEAVRAAAVLALGRIRAPHTQIIPDVTLCLRDPAPEVRYAAAVVLAGYGANARSALGNLRDCLKDPAEKVAMCAAGAIQKIEIGGQAT